MLDPYRHCNQCGFTTMTCNLKMCSVKFNFHRGKSDSRAILYKLESKYYNLKLTDFLKEWFHNLKERDYDPDLLHTASGSLYCNVSLVRYGRKCLVSNITLLYTLNHSGCWTLLVHFLRHESHPVKEEKKFAIRRQQSRFISSRITFYLFSKSIRPDFI
jgi:hypothetical protein